MWVISVGPEVSRGGSSERTCPTKMREPVTPFHRRSCSTVTRFASAMLLRLCPRRTRCVRAALLRVVVDSREAAGAVAVRDVLSSDV